MGLILLLAPLVFGEALSSSYLDLRRVSRPVLALAIGLVLTATLVVGGVVSLFVAMPLAVAFALGAIVSPTDAVAVSTIAKRASLPRRLVSILEGESLVNDGTGLTALRVAVVAAVAGSVTMLNAAGMLAAAVGIGVLVGALAGWGMSTVLRRSRDLVAANSLIVVAPFLIYVVAEEFEGSGILAVVVAALWLANAQHADPGWSGRLQGTTVWRHVTFILQSFAFCLIGLEIPEVFRRLGSDEVALVLVLVPVVLVTLVGTRFLFVGLMVVIERSRDRRRGIVRDQAVRQAVVVAWAGARGPVSGLAAFSLPLVVSSGEDEGWLTSVCIISNGIRSCKSCRSSHVAARGRGLPCDAQGSVVAYTVHQGERGHRGRCMALTGHSSSRGRCLLLLLLLLCGTQSAAS